MHYYELNIKSYRSKTSHLSDDEDLAYRRLLDLYYDTESPIQDSPQSVARLIRMPSKIDAIVTVLKEFFVLNDGFWHKGTCDAVIARYKKQKKYGKIGGEKRALNQKVAKGALPDPRQTLQATSNHKPVTKKEREDSPPTPSQTETEKKPDGKPKRPKPESIDMPTDWKPNFGHLEKCSNFGFEPNALEDEFRNYHAAKGNRFVSWDAAFHTWIGNAEKFRAEREANSARGNKSGTGSIAEAGLRVANRYRGKAQQEF